MRYVHLLFVGFAFGFLFMPAPAQADSRMDNTYLSVAAIASSDFEFAGDINREQEEGTGTPEPTASRTPMTIPLSFRCGAFIGCQKPQQSVYQWRQHSQRHAR